MNSDNCYLNPSDPRGYMRGWEGWNHPEREFILEQVGEEESFLDIGCGSGITYESIVRHLREDIKYKGVDYSRKFITACEELFPEAEWEKQSANKLREEDNSWDVTYIRNSLECMRYYDKPIKEAMRVAKRLGIFTFWNLFPDNVDDIKKEGTRTWGNRYGQKKLEAFLEKHWTYSYAFIEHEENGRYLGRHVYIAEK